MMMIRHAAADAVITAIFSQRCYHAFLLLHCCAYARHMLCFAAVDADAAVLFLIRYAAGASLLITGYY